MPLITVDGRYDEACPSAGWKRNAVITMCAILSSLLKVLQMIEGHPNYCKCNR
jgi:hypothetical protein